MVSESCSLSQQCCGQFLCLFRDSVWSPLLGRSQLLMREIVHTIGIRMSHRSLPLFIPRHCDRAVSGICHPSRVATGPTRLTSRKLELHPPIEHRQPACAGGAGNGAQEVAKESHMRRLECTGSRAAGLVGGQLTISRLHSGQFRSSY